MEAVLISGNRGQRAQGSEREYDGQREEAAHKGSVPIFLFMAPEKFETLHTWYQGI